jgi:hypothetical protein
MRAVSADDASGPTDSPGLIVVIDHARASVYRVDLSADTAHGITPYDPWRVLHHLGREMRDEDRDGDRDEAYPDDERFFEQTAAAVSSAGRIVVIGHGKARATSPITIPSTQKTRT